MATMEAGIHPPPHDGRAKRVALAALMTVVAINIWTGGPLLALWVGSRVQASTGSSLTIRPMTALVVFATLAAVSVALVKALGHVSNAYDRANGTASAQRRHDRWIADDGHVRNGLTALERILVIMVAIAALVFEIWFFFFSTSPIDQRSGRSSVPIAQATSTSTRSSPRLRNRSPIASAPSSPTRPAPIWTLSRPSSVQ